MYENPHGNKNTRLGTKIPWGRIGWTIVGLFWALNLFRTINS